MLTFFSDARQRAASEHSAGSGAWSSTKVRRHYEMASIKEPCGARMRNQNE
jgi:hypothetical protein